MTGHRRDPFPIPDGLPGSGAHSPEDLDVMQGAIEAVCAELGIDHSDGRRRDSVARRIIAVYQTGRRAPLYLVDAGLGMR